MKNFLIIFIFVLLAFFNCNIGNNSPHYKEQDNTQNLINKLRVLVNSLLISNSGHLTPSYGTAPFGYFKFDEESGYNVFDSAGTNHAGIVYNNDLTLYNGFANGSSIIDGRIGGAKFLFRDQSGYINLGNNILFNNTQKLSISAWIKLSNDISPQAFITKWKSGVAAGFWTDFYNMSPRFAFAPGQFITTAYTFNPDAWYHIVWVYDGLASSSQDKLKLYINGTLCTLNFNGYSVVSQLALTTANVNIGSYDDGKGAFLNGSVDEIGFWTYTLSTTQITELYNNGNGLTCISPCSNFPTEFNSGPVLYFKLDDPGFIMINSSLNNTITQGKIGNARSFNSSKHDYITFGDISEFHNSTKLTISAWVKLPNDTRTQAFITKWKVGIAAGFWTDFYNMSPRFAFAPGQFITTAYTFNPDAWYHIVWVYDGLASSSQDKLKLYINGTLCTLNFNGYSVPNLLTLSTANVNIGSYDDGKGAFLNGTVDEVGFWKNSLSISQITQLNNNGNGLTCISPCSNFPVVAEYGPYAYYKLDENIEQQTIVIDSVSSRNGNVNGVTYIEDPGKIDKARRLNNGYINLGDMNIFNNGEKLSISAWVKLPNDTRTQAFITKWKVGVAAGFWTDFYNMSPRFAFAPGQFITTAYTLSPDAWYHIVWVYDGLASSPWHQLKLYINGALCLLNFNGYSIPSHLTPSTANVNIGSYDDGKGAFLNGSVDEVGFWTYAVSAGQVQQHDGTVNWVTTKEGNTLYKGGDGSTYVPPCIEYPEDPDIKRAENLHSSSIVILAHSHNFMEEDIQRMKAGGVTAVVAKMTVDGMDFDRYTRSRFGISWDQCTYSSPTEWRMRFLYYVHKVIDMAQSLSGEVLIVRTVEDIDSAKTDGKLGIIIGSEGANQLEGENFYTIYTGEYYDLGWRETQLKWSNSNALIVDYALTPYGIEVIQALNEKGILIDVSHSTFALQSQIIGTSNKPVILSHDAPCDFMSGGYSNDEMLHNLAQNGGIFAVHFYKGLWGGNNSSNLETLLDGIDYLKSRIGVDHIALGPDHFPENGYEGLGWILPESRLWNLTLGLVRRGYSNEEIKKILGDNLKNLYGKVWK